MKESDPPEAFLSRVPSLFHRGMQLTVPRPESWESWGDLFVRGAGPFDRPLILLVDEFDRLPPSVIDQLVNSFRDLYLTRETSLLHGLALVGVRAVLGMDSDRGSPFNVQRSLHVPNLTQDEVRDLYAQYQRESGQPIEPQVVDKVYEVTRGQPGLVSWLGELLTEKYNPGRDRSIRLADWDRTYTAACFLEPNNTVLNLLKKAQGRYLPRIVELFTRADVVFAYDQPWCNYLYLHGVVSPEETIDAQGRMVPMCRFSSPFVQLRLYNALSADLLRGTAVPLVDLRDEMADVFTPAGLNAPALLLRYRDYLARLRRAGIDPWQGQPRRGDLHITEAVGHFHLYAWLQGVLTRKAVVSPEFPTGNGKVDLVIYCQGQVSLIEIKSLGQRRDLVAHRAQAADYARQKGLTTATLAVFLPVADDELLKELSGEHDVGGVRVVTLALG